MPNHYHFLIKQTEEYGISEFMHKLDTSYTMYFNLNNRRTGSLFEGLFKAKMIETQEVLIHVIRYILINAVVKGIVSSPIEWRWSSYPEYFDPEVKPICTIQEIIDYFGSLARFKAFIEDTDASQGLAREIEQGKDEDALFL